jgi:hypothetical protein
MKFGSLVFALLFSLTGIAQAAQEDDAVNEADSDDKVACIEAAIADDIEEGEQFDQFVQECLADRVAEKQKARSDKG